MTAATQTYFCRHCGYEVEGEAGTIPEGWFGLNQYTGNRAERPRRMGLYCSRRCLVAAAPNLPDVTRAERG